MKKGFTLVEMIAVIGIIAIMSLMVMPLIINQISSKKDDISDATKEIIYTATDLYLNNSVKTKSVGDELCVKIETLMSKGYLKSPLKDVKSGKNINPSQYVKTTVNQHGEYSDYTLLNEGVTCTSTGGSGGNGPIK